MLKPIYIILIAFLVWAGSIAAMYYSGKANGAEEQRLADAVAQAAARPVFVKTKPDTISVTPAALLGQLEALAKAHHQDSLALRYARDIAALPKPLMDDSAIQSIYAGTQVLRLPCPQDSAQCPPCVPVVNAVEVAIEPGFLGGVNIFGSIGAPFSSITKIDREELGAQCVFTADKFDLDPDIKYCWRPGDNGAQVDLMLSYHPWR